MCIHPMRLDSGPTAAALAAIEAESPLIAAELAVVDAECRLAVSADPLAVRAHRRAVAHLARVAREFVITPDGATPLTAPAASAPVPASSLASAAV